MARKIKPTLLTLNTCIYAVLCPDVGFLKIDGGCVFFNDYLPRASGCHTTYEDADTARAKAVENTLPSGRKRR